MTFKVFIQYRKKQNHRRESDDQVDSKTIYFRKSVDDKDHYWKNGFWRAEHICPAVIYGILLPTPLQHLPG